MAELLAPIALSSEVASTGSPVRVSQDVRVRRIRRPADFGASLKLEDGGSMHRTTSAAATLALGSNLSASGTQGLQVAPQLTRCSSVPATGTCKADEEAVATAKAKAVITF